jgi:hypothetical protein
MRSDRQPYCADSSAKMRQPMPLLGINTNAHERTISAWRRLQLLRCSVLHSQPCIVITEVENKYGKKRNIRKSK